MKVYGRDDSPLDDDEESETSSETTDTSTAKVGIADYTVTDSGDLLTTNGLGSCVGVAVRSNDGSVSGLAHVMLPSSEEVDDDNEAKFADTAIEAMVDEMRQKGASIGDMTAKIAGGSSMFDFSGDESIGERNVAAVRRKLDSLGIPIESQDVGGDSGRSIEFDPETGCLTIKNANREVKEI
ncbi:chemotaxis protein CheD [Halorutilales archaeon Cl-col2-1]